MLIYNITTKVDWSIHEQWVAWMKETHIPDMMKTSCFIQSQFVRILDIDETDGPTYATQLYADNKDNYNRYIEMFAAALRQEAIDTWGNLFIGFRSLMEVVH